MKKLLSVLFLIIGSTILWTPAAFAQSDTMDDVHLFQSFFRDAPIAATPYGEGFFNYLDYENLDLLNFGIRGGIPLTPEFELGTAIFARNLDFEGDRDGETGIADIPVFGRYNFHADRTKFSAGAFVTLPVGDEDIGQGQTNIGIFSSVRHPLSNEVVLTGNLGIDFLEQGDDDRDSQLNLGAGIIYAANQQVSIVGELQIESESEYTALSGGIDYQLANGGRLRGALLLGLDDGAPDIGLTGGYLFTF